MEYYIGKIKTACKTLAQKLFIIVQLYSENGLANHAAAGAYGFLLSLAPLLLLISIIIIYAFQSSPYTIGDLIKNISFFNLIFDEQWLSGNIFIISRPGIPSLVSVLSILWAGRILALSMQRGLTIIFAGTKTRSPVGNAVVTIAIEAAVLIYILTLIFGSRPAQYILKMFDSFTGSTFLHFITTTIGSKILPVILLGAISFFAYIFVPINHPKKKSALRGALFFSITYSCLSLLFNLLIDPSRYSFLYGALGSLILLVVNIYFLFNFFFLGAQITFVLDSFDTLLFIKFRQSRIKADGTGHHGMADRLFFSADGKLRKYCRFFKKGEIIFNQGDGGDEIYFLLEGEIDVIFYASDNYGTIANTLQSGSFFGEMSYLLTEDRSATAIARTDVSALALPPHIFDEIITLDTNLDRNIIEQMSRRIKNTNEWIASLASSDH